MDYELFCATLCTRSDLLVIHSLGYILMISLIYTILHTKSWVSAGVHTLAKKGVLAAFLVVIHQTNRKWTNFRHFLSSRLDANQDLQWIVLSLSRTCIFEKKSVHIGPLPVLFLPNTFNNLD